MTTQATARRTAGTEETRETRETQETKQTTRSDLAAAREAGATPPDDEAPESTWVRALSFLRRHWRAIGRIAAVALLLIVVLQNVEPTSVDLLFWSIGSLPKLVLIVVSMALGAGLWEVGRRRLGGSAEDEAGPHGRSRR